MRDGDGLFEVEPVGKKRPQGRAAAVDKTFRAFDPHQVLLLPPSLDDWLPEGHLARFVADLVDEVLDLAPILADYTEKRGYPPYDPRLMVRLLIYGYTTGRPLLPGDRAPLRRRRRVPVPGRRPGSGLPLDRPIPPPPPGRPRRPVHPVAAPGAEARHGQDGPRRPGRHETGGQRLQAQGDELRPPGRQGGAHRGRDRRTGGEGRRACWPTRRPPTKAEDQTFGVDGKEADLPAELDRREKRLGQDTGRPRPDRGRGRPQGPRTRRDKERRHQKRASTSDEQAVTEAGRAGSREGQPEPKAQANFTDPDSRIMKNRDGAYIQAYNAQAVVDEEHQVITAADVTTTRRTR